MCLHLTPNMVCFEEAPISSNELHFLGMTEKETVERK